MKDLVKVSGYLDKKKTALNWNSKLLRNKVIHRKYEVRQDRDNNDECQKLFHERALGVWNVLYEPVAKKTPKST